MRYFVSNAAHPLKYLSSGNLISKQNFLHLRRNIETNVLILVKEGTLYISQNEVNYKIGPNQYIFLKANENHFGYRASSGKLSYLWVHFFINDEITTITEENYFNDILERNIDDSMNQIYIIPEHGEVSITQRAPLLFNQLLDLSRLFVYLVVMLTICITSAFSSKISVQTYTLEADAKYQDIVFPKIPLTITDTSNDEETIIKKMMDEYTSKFTGPEAFMMKIEKVEYKEITIYEEKPCIVAKVKFAMQPSIPVQNGSIDFTWGKLAEDKKCYGQCLIEISKKDNEYTLEKIGNEEIDKLH